MIENAPKRIAIRFPNWVGDVVMAMPFLEAVHQNCPDAEIFALARSYSAQVIANNPWTSKIGGYHDQTLAGLREMRRDLRDFKPELTFLLPNSMRAYLPVAGLGCPRVFGYRHGPRSLFIDGPKPLRENGKRKPVPMTTYYLHLLEELGWELPEHPHPKLFFSEEEKQRADEILASHGISAETTPVIGMVPGAKFGSSKCWPPEYFAQLADLLHEAYNATIVIFGAPAEAATAESIVAQSKAPIVNTIPDKTNLSILKPLVDRCDLVVTNDTGTRHYATAFDKPTILIMGSTKLEHTRCHLEKTTVLQEKVPCGPCQNKKCKHGNHFCMRNLLPEKVFEAASEALAKL